MTSTISNIEKINLSFVSDETTKKLAKIVQDEYEELYVYTRVSCDKRPLLETICYNQTFPVLSVIHVPSDSHKLNLVFMEAIQLMCNYNIEDIKDQLLDLPISKVKEMFTVEQILED